MCALQLDFLRVIGNKVVGCWTCRCVRGVGTYIQNGRLDTLSLPATYLPFKIEGLFNGLGSIVSVVIILFYLILI